MLSQIQRPVCSIAKRAIRTYTSGSQPFQIAVVGSGPAGFYTALRIMETMPQAKAVKLDMYEALPVPFGLSRYGVAPDHPEVKSCQDRFAELPGKFGSSVRYIGNTRVGIDIALKDLKENYDAVVLAYGSQKDRLLGIPGEKSNGVFSAREFVGWYNGVPELADKEFHLDQAENVTIVGMGNVALDLARILLCDVDRLKTTDITEHAYEKLKHSKVKNVRLVARRGILQSAFTTKELRELINEPGVSMTPIKPEYLEFIQPFIPLLERTKKRMVQVLQRANSSGVTSDKTWTLDYLRSPVEIYPNRFNSNILDSTKFEINEIDQPDLTSPARATGTRTYEIEKNDLLFRSIGYKSEALPGMESELGVEFNSHNGIVVNTLGRANNAPGVYVAGWLKNGPMGVIAHTMADSFSVGESVVKDLVDGNLSSEPKPGFEGVKKKIKSKVVEWKDWEKIDKAERERGAKFGKEREKFVKVDDMLNAI